MNKPQLIAHRCNSIAQLNTIAPQHGVELDIRSHGTQLIINHEPYLPGEDFANWLDHYHHELLVLNVKEAGLEAQIIQELQHRKINNYFFLDQAFPCLIKWSRLGEPRCAVRYSEFEAISTALALAGRIAWVWVDYFTHCPLTQASATQLHTAGYKICVVSPELQGHDPKTSIPTLQKHLNLSGIIPDAVCTKYLELWG